MAKENTLSNQVMPKDTSSKFNKLKKIIINDFLRNKYIYIMAIPGIIYYIIFHYVPMYGVIIAFKNFTPAQRILGSNWIGFDHFTNFFKSYYFERLLFNTVLINFYNLIWGFPAPIVLALLLNELHNQKFKKLVQTVTYLPHFISIVVICGLITIFTAENGLFNDIIEMFGGTRTNLLMKANLFRTIYVASGIWQGVGWGTIVYLASLSCIDQELYEAANIDGANRFKKAIHITLPGITPTIVVLLILRIGRMMSVGADKIILLYNSTIYETADVISTFVYRKGIIDANYSYSTAIGLFNSFINFALLILSNKISQKVNETSLW